MENTKTLSIIIVNWNTRDLLRRCLESVGATVPPLSFEVIVVDNASTDGSPDMVAESFPDALLIRNPSNDGFAAANNLGLAKSNSKYVMLLNPDAELHPGAVQRMIDFADAHPEAAVVGPRLLNSDGSLQKNGQKFPTFAREFLHITKLYRFMGSSFDRIYEWGRDDFDKTSEVDSVTGACMLVRSEAVKAVGLLDDIFFMYYEEVDWCYRMHRAGWKVYYLPDAVVTHHHGQASEKIGLTKMRIAYNSQFLYFRKHHGVAQALILRILAGFALIFMSAKRRRS
jgi:hypothetical protein